MCVWNLCLNITLQNTPSQVPGPFCVILGIFVVFPHIKEINRLAAIQPGLGLPDRTFFDAAFGSFHERQEPRILLH